MTREVGISQTDALTGPDQGPFNRFALDRALAPRRDCALEWWFVQGVYAPPSQAAGCRHFMAGLFRHRLDAPGVPPVWGTSLLVTVLDPARQTQRVTSLIDPAIREFFIENPGVLRKFAVDRRFVDVFLEMLETQGPPGPIRIDKRGATIENDPPSVRWGDFAVCAADGRFELLFREPETGAPVSFVLRPERTGADIEAADRHANAARKIGGITYPRMVLSGDVRGRSVMGRAWFTHQWGDNIWFVSGAGSNRPVAWDWLELNLDNGEDWIVSVAREVRGGRPLGRRLVVLDASGSPLDIARFSLRPLRFWESPRTGIRHPVEWRLRVPSLGADLNFAPLADDQEIPVFGVMRAIWQGAGRVEGKVKDCAVQGEARGKFHGSGYILEFRDAWRAAAERVDLCLREFFPPSLTSRNVSAYTDEPVLGEDPALFTRMIAGPAWELLRRGGKRWRPIFGWHMLGALGCDPGPFEGLIAALSELPHTGSLIIDDIQDRSSMRRGDACIHLLYGEGPSINAANTLYFLPQLLLEKHAKLDPERKLEIHRLLVRQYVRAHFGQARDLESSSGAPPAAIDPERLGNGDGTVILRMYEQKTAAPVVGIAEMAAVIAGVSPAVRRACAEFGRALGTAFQIVDDIRDFGKTASSGSEWGKDLAEGKITYVVARALEMMSGPEREELLRLLISPKLRADPANRKQGIAMVRRSGALAACHDEAGAMVGPAWATLASLLGPSEHKMILRLLSLNLVDFAAGL